jgi:hypothetical protein
LGEAKPTQNTIRKEKNTMKEELSTGCTLPTAELKKREGEKRKSPLTPYREKLKGKEGR